MFEARSSSLLVGRIHYQRDMLNVKQKDNHLPIKPLIALSTTRIRTLTNPTQRTSIRTISYVPYHIVSTSRYDDNLVIICRQIESKY